jgi:phage gp45-like
MNIIRGKLTEVSDGAKRVAGFIGRLTSFGKRPFVQQYGYFSRPKDGAEGVMVRFGDNMVIIASGDERYTISLQPGEVAIGTPDGDKIHIKQDHKIAIEANGDAVKPGEITINAKGSGSKVVVIADKIELGEGMLQKIINGEAFKLLYNTLVTTGNMGFPAPLMPACYMQEAHLSNTVSAVP